MAKDLNVIRQEGGDNHVLVTKVAIEDFKRPSLLIVDESQLALFYKDGQAEGPFRSGRYELPTDNPSKFRAMFSKLFGKTPERVYSCDVFFVNTVNDVTVSWGTPTRILVKDPVYNELVNVGANGSVKVKVSDAMRFVVSVAGRMQEYTLDRLMVTIRSEVLTVLKTFLSNTVNESKVSLLEIQGKLLDLSKSVERRINERLADFGLTAVHFNIEDISLDAASEQRLLDRQRKINNRSDIVLDAQAQTEADSHRTMQMADAMAYARERQGFTYQDEQYWRTQQTMAANPGYGPNGFMGGPMPMPGMGMGYAAAKCPNCGQPIAQGAAFCPACGSRVAAAQPAAQHSYSAPAGRRCPRCGCPVLPRATTCPGCDYDFGGGDEK